MHKLWILIKSEYLQVVKKKSFLIGVILTPVFMLLVTVVPTMLATKKSDTTEKLAIVDIDNQGIGERFRDAISRYKLDDSSAAYMVTDIYRLSAGDSAALSELQSRLDSMILDKRLKYYMVIFDNVEQNDSVYLVGKSFGFRTSNRFENRMSNILSGMRLEKSNVNLDVDSVLGLTRSLELMQKAPGGKERDFLTLYLGGIVFVMIIFGTLIGYGQILMRSVIEEKNSRIIEVLVSSVSPFQLMAGKIIGLGMASLTQVLIWFIIGAGLYMFRGNLEISADIAGVIFNPVFIFFFVAFLLVGYIMFSTLFALIGSLVNTDKEAQGFIFPITMTLILPIIIAAYLIQEPDSTVAVVLSLIPFFTPTMMILRLNFMGADTFNFSNPIILEAFIGLGITILTSILVIWITAKVFRVGILMYGKRPTLPEIFKWIKHG